MRRLGWATVALFLTWGCGGPHAPGSSGGGNGCSQPGSSGSVTFTGGGHTDTVSCFSAATFPGSGSGPMVQVTSNSSLHGSVLGLYFAASASCAPAAGASLPLEEADGGCLTGGGCGYDSAFADNCAPGPFPDNAGDVVVDHWSTTVGQQVSFHFSQGATMDLVGGDPSNPTFTPVQVSGNVTAQIIAAQ